MVLFNFISPLLTPYSSYYICRRLLIRPSPRLLQQKENEDFPIVIIHMASALFYSYHFCVVLRLFILCVYFWTFLSTLHTTEDEGD